LLLADRELNTLMTEPGRSWRLVDLPLTTRTGRQRERFQAGLAYVSPLQGGSARTMT
jgi:hypothetical protein